MCAGEGRRSTGVGETKRGAQTAAVRSAVFLIILFSIPFPLPLLLSARFPSRFGLLFFHFISFSAFLGGRSSLTTFQGCRAGHSSLSIDFHFTYRSRYQRSSTCGKYLFGSKVFREYFFFKKAFPSVYAATSSNCVEVRIESKKIESSRVDISAETVTKMSVAMDAMAVEATPTFVVAGRNDSVRLTSARSRVTIGTTLPSFT